MPIREIEIAASAAARFTVPNGDWITVPLAGLSRSFSITDDAPGQDVAYIEIDNISGTAFYFVCYDADSAGTGDPAAAIVDFTTPAPAGGTEGVGFMVGGHGFYTLDKVRGITHISFWASVAHTADVQIAMHSYRTATEVPW